MVVWNVWEKTVDVKSGGDRVTKSYMVLWCERRGFGKINTTMFRELRFDLMQLGWCGVGEVEVVGLDAAMVWCPGGLECHDGI